MRETIKSAKGLAIVYGVNAGLCVTNFLLKLGDSSYTTCNKIMSLVLAGVWVMCTIAQTKSYCSKRKEQNVIC